MSQIKKFFSILVTIAIIISIIPSAILAEKASIVYLTVENTTYTAQEGAIWDGQLLDCIPVEVTEGETKIVDVIISGIENSGYSQTGAESGYITDINGLGEFS